MSLVEKALKKLHDSRSAEDSAPVPIRRVSEAPAFDPAAAPAQRSDKRIAINEKTLRIAGLMPPEGHERRFATEYRQIKRPLIAAAFGKGVPRLPNGRSIMVASALPGEGKTFTSINLALSLALEKDFSVLLVDADVAKPHISRTFGVSEEPGLLDVVRDEAKDIESVIIPTETRGLSILPAGRHIETATELLASARMEHLVAALMNRDPNRVVLFDSPPLLLTTESRALAGVVGQVVIVVRAESTLKEAVVDALNCLGEGKSVGLILNQSETTPPNIYYGYGDYGDAPRKEE